MAKIMPRYSNDLVDIAGTLPQVVAVNGFIVMKRHNSRYNKGKHWYKNCTLLNKTWGRVKTINEQIGE